MKNNKKINKQTKKGSNFYKTIYSFYKKFSIKKAKKHKIHKITEYAFYSLIAIFVGLTFLSRINLKNLPKPIQTIQAEQNQDDIALINNLLIDINKARIKEHLNTLKISSTLQATSLLKSYLIFNLQIFAHNLPNINWQVPFDIYGLSNYPKGEVLAVGLSEPKQITLHWLSSKTHKQVLLNPKFNAIGFSVVHGKIGGQNTIIIVGHLAKLPKNLIDNTIFPLPKTKIYTNAKTKYINFYNKQGRVVVIPNINLENSKINQDFYTINGVTVQDIKVPYIQFNLKTFEFISHEQVPEQNRIQLNTINIKPFSQVITKVTQTKTTHTPQLNTEVNTNTTQNLNNTSNILQAQVNIPKNNLKALVLGTKISKGVSKISNVISLQIIIAIFALAISVIYAHTAPENKKKYILVEIFWAILIFGASLGI